MLSCQEATRLISLRQDRPLTAAEAVRLRIHVMICTGCRRCAQQLAWLDQLAARYARRVDTDMGAEQQQQGHDRRN